MSDNAIAMPLAAWTLAIINAINGVIFSKLIMSTVIVAGIKQALKHQAGILKEKSRAEDLPIRRSVEDFMPPLAIPLKMNAVQ